MVKWVIGMEIRKVLIRTDGIKYVIVPKASKIQAGDYVKLTKMEEKDGKKRS